MERLWPPGVPVDRIVRMLEEVGGFLVDEAVGILVFAVGWFHGGIILSGEIYR